MRTSRAQPLRFTRSSPNSVTSRSPTFRGKIVASARAYAELNEDRRVDLRGVLLDAQFTNGVPTGTTFGVNGLASDLSIINSIPGVEGSTTHIVIPEPLTSAATTVAMNLLGGLL